LAPARKSGLRSTAREDTFVFDCQMQLEELASVLAEDVADGLPILF
jgi:hypothetical protein